MVLSKSCPISLPLLNKSTNQNIKDATVEGASHEQVHKLRTRTDRLITQFSHQ